MGKRMHADEVLQVYSVNNYCVFGTFHTGTFNDFFTAGFYTSHTPRPHAQESIKFFSLRMGRNIPEEQRLIYYCRPDGSIGIIDTTDFSKGDCVLNRYADFTDRKEFKEELLSKGGLLIWVSSLAHGFDHTKNNNPDVVRYFGPEGSDQARRTPHYFIHIPQSTLEEAVDGIYIPELGYTVGFNKFTIADVGHRQRLEKSSLVTGLHGYTFVLDTDKTSLDTVFYLLNGTAVTVKSGSRINAKQTLDIYTFEGAKQPTLVASIPISDALEKGVQFNDQGRTVSFKIFACLNDAYTHKDEKDIELQRLDELIKDLRLKVDAEQAKLRDFHLKQQEQKEKDAKKRQGFWAKLGIFIVDHCLKPVWFAIKAIALLIFGILI